MKISLDRFEHQVDETILKRGFNYFRNGHVTDVDESDEGIYEVTVGLSEQPHRRYQKGKPLDRLWLHLTNIYMGGILG